MPVLIRASSRHSRSTSCCFRFMVPCPGNADPGSDMRCNHFVRLSLLRRPTTTPISTRKTSTWGRAADRLQFRLSRRLSVEEPQASDFSTIDHIPEQAPRHERWRTDYRRNPYLQLLTNDQLRDRFDEIMLINTLSFLKDPPVVVPKEQTTASMERFTHIMLEMANRAIPITAFAYDPRRDIAAGRRIGLPESVER
jgi:hypothetical protein